jgi:hypothetical protein
MTADATFARRLLREPLVTATAHPHYPVHLDAQDRATLQTICSCSQNVDEMLKNLADVIDGNPA